MAIMRAFFIGTVIAPISRWWNVHSAEVFMKVSRLLLLISGIVLVAAFLISGCKVQEKAEPELPEIKSVVVPEGELIEGDVNGDGMLDAAIIAKKCVHIYHGPLKERGARDALICLPGEPLEAAFGDLNGDGHDDLVVGLATASVFHCATKRNAGVVYVFLGSRDGIADRNIAEGGLADIIISSYTGYGRLGARVAVVDINKDNYMDILMSRIGSDESMYNQCVPGRVFLMFGSSDIDERGHYTVEDFPSKQILSGKGCDAKGKTDAFGSSLDSMGDRFKSILRER